MKLSELKAEIKKYQYLEDDKIIDVALATVIATRCEIGAPLWLVIIGAPSGGKSQILRPIAMTDSKFLHRIDDLTENTFLSAAKSKEGEISLLNRIGKKGVIVMSDLTVLFSKQTDTRNAILAQFRMIYDGEFKKDSGNSNKSVEWKGHMGVLAGSTPSIYHYFEEVSDMGERFIYYRMKEFDPYKATMLALSRTETGHNLDDILSSKYEEYLSGVVKAYKEQPIQFSEEDMHHITEVSMFAEKVRTLAHQDKYKGVIDRIPVSALPMRTAQQLQTLGKGLAIMNYAETGEFKLPKDFLGTIDWCAYCLANEEKRMILKILASVDFERTMTTATISDNIGLATAVTNVYLQNLSAVGVVQRSGDANVLYWKFKEKKDYDIVRRIEHLEQVIEIENRESTTEEGFESLLDNDF